MSHTPGIAAVLSLLIPGMGQVYNGKFLRALVWFIITPGLWIGSGGVLGLDMSSHFRLHGLQIR